MAAATHLTGGLGHSVLMLLVLVLVRVGVSQPLTHSIAFVARNVQTGACVSSVRRLVSVAFCHRASTCQLHVEAPRVYRWIWRYDQSMVEPEDPSSVRSVTGNQIQEGCVH